MGRGTSRALNGVHRVALNRALHRWHVFILADTGTCPCCLPAYIYACILRIYAQGGRPQRCAAHREAEQVCLTSKPWKLCQFREWPMSVHEKKAYGAGGLTETGFARMSYFAHCTSRATHGSNGTPVSVL